MSVRAFVKDRTGLIVTDLCGLLAALVFFFAFRSSISEIVIITVILILTRIIAFFIEFSRKRSFYDSLSCNVSGLDKKYLVSETLARPDFLEGSITYDALCDAGKAMCEEVNSCRSDYKEFKNYIELWVHEIKLPVASLLLTAHSDESNKDKYIPQLKRVDEYIENVLYYARSENSEKDYLITEVSLKRAFTDAALKAREELLLRNITLETEGLDVSVRTDSKWLEFIFGQLISNAMKYASTERDPVIRVEAVDLSDEIKVSFYDNGIGINAADLPRVFDKSFTGRNGRTLAKSTGMGLYIVKTLCERLGHRIEIESKEGEYTKLTITFGKNGFMTFE